MRAFSIWRDLINAHTPFYTRIFQHQSAVLFLYETAQYTSVLHDVHENDDSDVQHVIIGSWPVSMVLCHGQLLFLIRANDADCKARVQRLPNCNNISNDHEQLWLKGHPIIIFVLEIRDFIRIYCD